MFSDNEGASGIRSAGEHTASELLFRVRKGGRKGVALILVMILVSVLVVVVYQLSLSVGVERRRVEMEKGRVCGVYGARAAVSLARAYLEKDAKSNATDALSDCWAGDVIKGRQFGDTKVTVTIKDAERFIPLQDLQKSGTPSYVRTRTAVKRLLRNLGWEEEASALANSLADWIDSDKKGDYEVGTPNKVPTILEDLLRVPEMNERIFYGYTNPDTEETVRGFREFVTLYGMGRVNINTAPKEVLMAMSAYIDEEKADAIVDYRREKRFVKPTDLAKVPGLEMIFKRDPSLKNYLTTVSTYFIVRFETEDTVGKVKGYAVIRRVAGKTALIYWKEE